MIVHDVIQGSTEWRALRAGMPTASEFSRILTPKNLKPSAQVALYAAELCAEWLLGAPLSSGASQWMDRGTEMESEAFAWFALIHGENPQKIGFVTDDALTVGCSPDALVGDDALAEFKVPGAGKHVLNLLNQERFQVEHQLQVQGQLWITGRARGYLVSYNPDMPRCVVKIERDDVVISAIAEAVEATLLTIADYRERLIGMGCSPRATRVRNQCSATGVDCVVCRCDACVAQRGEAA